MDFLIGTAWAAGPQPEPNVFVQLMPLIILLVIFYFLLIRPQAKRNKEHQTMVAGLAKGDEIVTTGGMAGRVTGIGEVYFDLEIADGVTIKVQKHAVASVLPKGTLKSL